MKDSFVFYTKYKKQFELLDSKQQGMLIMAVFEYANSGTVIKTNDTAVDMAFSFIQHNLDKDKCN